MDYTRKYKTDDILYEIVWSSEDGFIFLGYRIVFVYQDSVTVSSDDGTMFTIYLNSIDVIGERYYSSKALLIHHKLGHRKKEIRNFKETLDLLETQLEEIRSFWEIERNK